MKIDNNIRFNTLDWDSVKTERHNGTSGFALWKVKNIGDIRIRKVEYSPGYIADHWCEKGHIIYCIKGEMTSELKNGAKHILKEGMVYFVGEQVDPHRSSTQNGVTLFIVD